MGKHSFSSKERLKSKSKIDALFSEGQNLNSFPVKLVFKTIEGDSQDRYIEAGFSVPKRLHRKAVTRNRYKRQIKESFRLNKYIYLELLQKLDIKVFMMFIYISKKEESFQSIERSTIEVMNKLIKSLEN